MDDETTTEGTDTPTTVATGDVEEIKPPHTDEHHGKSPKSTGGAEAAKDHGHDKVAGGEGEAETEKSEVTEGSKGGETDEEGTEDAGGEHVVGEGYGEEYEEYYIEEEIVVEEQIEGEHVEGEEKAHVEGEELPGEGLEGEHVEGEESEQKEEAVPEEVVEEEQQYIEEPPPDPTAPYDFSDSKEALKAPFQLRPDQLAEVEQLWEMYQDHTPAYSNLDGFVTEKELVYMLKSLLLMTFTYEQLQELIGYCCRPPNAKGQITYEQFLKMVTIRQRDFPIEEEIRSAMQVYDPEKTGAVDRDYLKEILSKHGHKMHAKMIENLIKEVDMSNDGTIGIEDVVGTMCLDLNKDDLMMLRLAVNPPEPGSVNPQGGQEDETEDADD